MFLAFVGLLIEGATCRVPDAAALRSHDIIGVVRGRPRLRLAVRGAVFVSNNQ